MGTEKRGKRRENGKKEGKKKEEGEKRREKEKKKGKGKERRGKVRKIREKRGMRKKVNGENFWLCPLWQPAPGPTDGQGLLRGPLMPKG